MGRMNSQALPLPSTDPSGLFEIFRGAYGTELLVSAVAHFHVFEKLAAAPMSGVDLQQALGLDERAFVVLITALRAMGLIEKGAGGHLALSQLAREHVVSGEEFFVGDYFSQLAESPGVREMTRRLRSSKPAGHEENKPAQFIFREGIDSAMEEEKLARELTLRLSGRAKNVAPVLARNLPLEGVKVLLDVGGGSGIYSIAYLRRHPELRAIVYDRPEVLKVAGEFAKQYGVADRLEMVYGDMFTTPLPAADAILLSNVLHDWDVPRCRMLVRRCAEALPRGGRLLIHDVFLNDELDGPLPVAIYSAALFSLTEGRAYSAAEYNGWLAECGLVAKAPVSTLIHCGVIEAVK
jgi:predicted O-methyltransferase YrrM